MRKILLLILISSGILNAQVTEFTFTKDGFSDYVITQCEGKTQSEIFKKTIDWVSVSFKNSQAVIQSKIENEFIRIEGFKESLVCINTSLYGKECRDGKFVLEISFKDGKYKLEITDIEQFLEATTNRSGSNYPARWMPIKNVTSYERSGEKHKGEIISTYKYFMEIPTYFNGLNKSLGDFVMSNNIPSKKTEW